MLCHLRVFVLAASVLSPATVVGQLFTDDLSTGTNWTIYQDPDASAVFGFDYSTKGLPPAPNGSDTIGLKFEVNNNAPADANGIVAINSNATYTGQYTFRVDAWLNWAPSGGTIGTGTTEFLGAGVGHDGPLALPLGGSFVYSSEGDAAATDYRLYKEGEQLQSESGQYAAGNVAGSRDSSDPYYTNAFPSFDIATAVPTQGTTGTQPAGAGGFQWMTLNFEVDTVAIGPSGTTTDPGYVRVSMQSANSGNAIIIGTIDNSNGDFTAAPLEGVISLVMFDFFSSVTLNPAFAFGIFDNVQVLDGLVPLVPEGLAGDFDNDSDVDGNDFLVWQRNTSVGSLNDWQTNYGSGVGTSVAATAVPEPSPLLMLLTLAFATLLFRAMPAPNTPNR
ncbi:hypothetical protein [Bythopirellula goksoeyrii]|uniref:PEP-CTERM protein-sorting domain-containing protein n=1 Tax=Bythopirellula goksoeyrii TaxID=1400387 RepID=A0A5B9QD80_9BACT|nr:hypothetical protein [Bythopirellula goksoeyrii]QEG36908.1 hypothetical protein Pr1d_42480 [Bythopirellula goksoeyrii]